MKLTVQHPALRWWAPAAVVIVVAGTALIARTAGASVGAGSLPNISADQLISDVQHADVTGVSGTVVESADLGLPDLPDLGSGTQGLTGMLTGTHTLRVWADGTGKQRVALLSSGGESDIIRSGSDLWLWDSADNAATHITLPTDQADASGTATPSSAPSSTPSSTPPSTPPMDPTTAAQQALSMLGASTTVTVTQGATVAGRAAYELVLTPTQAGSLVKAVRIAVDGATHVPLQVQVDSVKTAAPALSIGFTSVTFGTPDPAEFAFTPPPGATVKQGTTADLLGGSGLSGGLPQMTNPTVVGTGWTRVAVGAAPTTGSAPAPDAQGAWSKIVNALPRASGSWGSGRVLEGTLFTAVFGSDGAVAIGATEPPVVYSALAGK